MIEMPLSFMMPLAVVLLSIYIFKKSADEISYLAACISIIALLLSLFIAPWQLKSLLLGIAIFSTRQFSLPSQPVIETQEDQKNTLSYRGIDYEPTSPTVEGTESQITGKYRGQAWKCNKADKTPPTQLTSRLKYRGANVVSQASHTPVTKEQKVTPES